MALRIERVKEGALWYCAPRKDCEQDKTGIALLIKKKSQRMCCENVLSIEAANTGDPWFTVLL
jgi:hypothetical protein